MPRYLTTAALLWVLPTTAMAEDILLRADIEAATVYANGAQITRAATVPLSVGEHTILIAMPDVGLASLIQVDGPGGLALSPPQRVSGFQIAEGALDDAEQAAARQAVDAAGDAVVDAEDAISEAEAAIGAIEAQQAYLQALTEGGESGIAMPDDPALVPQFLATLGAEMARVSNELVTTLEIRRTLDAALADRVATLDRARDAFTRLRPFEFAVDGIAVRVSVTEPVEVPIRVTYQTGGVFWQTSYDLRLESDSGQLDLNRFIRLNASTPARWNDVSVTFSTDNPGRQRSPQEVFSTPVRIAAPELREVGAAGGFGQLRLADTVAAPLVSPAEAPAAQVVTNGLSLQYAYEAPVTVGLTGEVLLPFDDLTFATETEARGAPRFDQTAFLMAMGINDSGEPILPGEARFYRDGALVGEGFLDLVPTGGEMDLAFGPLDHLRLIWIDRSLAEGDRGVFVSSNTQERRISFGVENLGDTTETVRLIYATPFAEQEDVSLDLTLQPTPDERDVDDLRGVEAWAVDIAPGATEMIDMAVELGWPEDQVLTWRP